MGLYVLKETDFLDWLPDLFNHTNFTLSEPKKYVKKSSKDISHIVDLSVNNPGTVYIILDNRHSIVTVKEDNVMISEEFDEILSSLDVVTTIPPRDKSLNTDVMRIIQESNTDLKIVTPYIDMSLISEILSKIDDGLTIRIITRTRDEFKGKDKKAAFDHLKQRLNNDHKTNEYVHSRLIVRDNKEILVSSADLTQDSLIGQFNAGLTVSDNNVIKKLIDYFEVLWNKSKLK